MDSRFYVSLEAARLLKEKGYDGDAEYAYHEIGSFSLWGINVNDIDYLYAAPSKAEAIDWLESKGMYVEIHGIGRESNRRYCYTIFGQKTGLLLESKYIFPTRLEAEEAAIIKALELLKNGN